MYPPKSNAYESQYPTPTPPPSYGQPTTTGFPVSSATNNTSSYYSSDNSQQYGSALQIESKPRVPWSTGLCDCASDWKLCCITCWCPCITFGRIAEIVDKGSSSCGVNGALYTLIACVTACACCYSCFYRSKMRQQYLLHERPCCDCLVHCCCEPCALCQEYRELESRGFDMIIGWHGNVEQRNRGVIMAPSVDSGMSR
ncbi:hypothetical protein L6164_001527 [Bauhinia variegata]|uniref:Uncharacterized protein n=1 Tax=Bauhinia variegata TaxID=167791 RepID=A0ACB9QC22_BAUVA|nr:hypothetical protein L6164_001527 [Bauhinia variegata]